MKIILIMVSSVNGKITRGDNPDVYAWSSAEDTKLFTVLKNSFDLIIMGSKTYLAAKKKLFLNEDKLRIVLTGSPRKYANEAIPDRLEFTDEPPENLIHRLEKEGYNKALLVGGSEINSLFLKSRMVDELHITIEPKLFGTGKNLLADSDVYTDMTLTDVKKLNQTGSLHLIYNIQK